MTGDHTGEVEGMLRGLNHCMRNWLGALRWDRIIGSDDESRVDEQKRHTTDGYGPDVQKMWAF